MIKIFGIDISEYQKNINLNTAKKEGVKFVIIRAGFTGYASSKKQAVDSAFESHYKNAKKEKLGVGAYFFSRATSYKEGKKEATFMYDKCLKNKQFEYPIYIDVEDNYYQRKASKKAVTEGIKGFCEYLSKKKYYVGIYANSNWFNNYIDTPNLIRYDKWIANWGDKKPNNPPGGMWQFGGGTNELRSNKIAGFICDQNYAYKDYPVIMKEKGLNGFNKIKKAENNSINNQKKATTYIVKKGDTLSKIASNYKMSYKELAKYNNISNPNLIKVGQKIEIPIKTIISTKTYTVKKGDTLSSIAKKYNTTWQKIYKDNKKTIKENPNFIKPGQILVIKQ